MKKLKIEFKWALIFIASLLVWMALERLVGLHDTHLAYHPYVTNAFAIVAIFVRNKQ